jgi:hypothetical protein
MATRTRTSTKKPAAPKVSSTKSTTQGKKTKTVKSPAKKKGSAKSAPPVSYIAMVIDRSGSMSRIKKDVVKVFNEQLKTIKENAKTGLPTFISLYTFETKVDKPVYTNKPAAKVEPMKALVTAGATALLDAVGTAITDLGKANGAKNPETSFLVITLTDGYENSSTKYKKSLPSLIKKVQATGRWSLAFLSPKSGIKALKSLGIPEGNLQDWSTTTKGAREMGERVRRGLDTFFNARRAGKTSVSSFFTTDLSAVSIGQVSGKLKDSTREFHQWGVDAKAGIRDFVNGKLNGGGAYQPGSGYYELTKPEVVQAAKEFAIMDSAGKIYAGASARGVLGLPEGEKFKVKPGTHGDWRVFVMSTSNNRALAKGTTLLYRK